MEMQMIVRVLSRLAAVATLFVFAGNAFAADAWPSRSIRWIVPYTPAGTTDILARIMGQRLGERLGQTVVIDNRPGAGNNIGTEIAIKAAPDGYTWFLSSAPALVDLIAGQMHVMFENMPGCITYVRSGDLRALAVTTAQRSPVLPNVPTVAESVPGFEASAWFGLTVPKGTPEAIVSRINREVNDALKDQKMLQRLADLGGTPIAGTPADFWAVHTMETEKWAKVVKASGAKVQ